MSFAVIENTPGYLPEWEPEHYDTLEEANEAARALVDELIEDGYHLIEGATLDASGPIFAKVGRDGSVMPDLGRVVEVQEVTT